MHVPPEPRLGRHMMLREGSELLGLALRGEEVVYDYVLAKEGEHK
ncbi:hypothetical protein GCM10011374_34600 [Kocuria dechangensis]|uniref:Uncharacterized protein n=1 Tax=Kocuria dechangensis TaxID=1176249 RepID=A0A917H4M0_9MICC|nr:hypothetical protein GCM10011374_34600 [Kocuria dechangensis]